ncbi:MAG: DUF5063 domain-containing protein [Tannerella sp.]|jgi:NTP pyrophosphatase (non-canonical NTP hydrolase)|nr:DUF5063 domain-containing protein [Tannerella sp.]
MENRKVLFDRNTLEFVTVTLEFCALMEATERHTLFAFVDKGVKIIPLLYLKAAMLPAVEEPFDADELDYFITEETYEVIRARIASLFGEHDSYLETFHPDIEYSDTPIATTISESLADVYQDLGNFAALFRQENEAVMHQALYVCNENFRLYWGQKLLNALRAIHCVRFSDEIQYSPEDENE